MLAFFRRTITCVLGYFGTVEKVSLYNRSRLRHEFMQTTES